MNLFSVNESCLFDSDSLFAASLSSNSISSYPLLLLSHVEFESPWCTVRAVTVSGGTLDNFGDDLGELSKLSSNVSWDLGFVLVWTTVFTLRLPDVVDLNKVILSLQLVGSVSVAAFTCWGKLDLYLDVLLHWVEVVLGVYPETDVWVYGDPHPSVITDDLSLSLVSLLDVIWLDSSSLISFFRWYCPNGNSGAQLKINPSQKKHLMRS